MANHGSWTDNEAQDIVLAFIDSKAVKFLWPSSRRKNWPKNFRGGKAHKKALLNLFGFLTATQSVAGFDAATNKTYTYI